MNKKILLTNFELVQFSGSEINIITIASYFKSKGYDIYIVALDFGYPILKEIENKGYELINLIKDDFDFSSINFDIVWCQHSFILDWLIFEKKLLAKKIVISSLSPFEPFESVQLPYIDYINKVIANSQETKNKLESENLNNVHVFENSATNDFFENSVKVEHLKNIAVISNHIPEEMNLVIEILKNKNYIVDIFGLAGNKLLIGNEVLKNYDLVISIGKTVQYCMAQKIPCYVYDKFGGPGFITNENIEINRINNFSGRPFNKKEPELIVSEILNNFEKQLLSLDFLYNYALEYFNFEKNMNIIINDIENDKKEIDLNEVRDKYSYLVRNKQIYEKLYIYSYYKGESVGQAQRDDFYKKQYDMYKNDNRILKDELKKVEKISQEYIEQIKELDYKLNSITSSRSWKLISKFNRLLNKRSVSDDENKKDN